MVSYASTGGHVCAMWHVVQYTRGGSKLQNGCLEASAAELSYRFELDLCSTNNLIIRSTNDVCPCKYMLETFES